MGSEVNVHTSLPPGVEGRVFSHLCLQIPYIIWNKTFKKHLQDKFYVKVCWWGEKTNGAIFYPSVIYDKPCNNVPKIMAKYNICSDHMKFSTYLKDMKKLCLKVLSASSVLGITNIDVSSLSSNFQVSGLFPVISHTKKKVAELFVKITMDKFIDGEINSNFEKSLDCTTEKTGLRELKMQQDARRNHTDIVVDNSDLITALLEKAENLRQAMIISLLENKNLESVLENETKRLNEEVKKTDLIENVLGIQKNISQPSINNGDNDDSISSSLELKINELSESFDSVPDDTIINELFYSDANVGQISATQEHRDTRSVRFNDSRKAFIQAKPNNPVENKQYKTGRSHHMSQELKLFLENIKVFKVKIKDITFQLSKTTSKAAVENSIHSLLQQNKQRTFIVEFMSPFPVKVGLWDQKGHRKESTNLLKFISRRVKHKAVSFEQEVIIPFETNICAEEIIEKKLGFCAKARLHDIRKIIDLGKGSIQVKDFITVGSSFFKCCIPLNNIETASGMEYKQNVNEVQPMLQIEVSLVLSEFKLPVHKAVATSDDDIIKDNENAAVINTVSGDDPPANKCDLILTEPLHCILQISEGKKFGEKKWLHIVCRLFFSKNSIFRDILYNPDEPSIFFSQIFPIMLNKELLKQTENNIMIIEVWERLDLSERMHLKGLCKLPLHCYYLVFKNAALAKSHLLSKYPIISTSGETPVIHPITGICNGEFNILFALGTLQQIDNILEDNFHKINVGEHSVNFVTSRMETPNIHPVISEVKSSARVPHILELSVQELGGLKIASNMVWGEADCYVTYCFPTQENGEVKVHQYKSNSQLVMPDVVFKSAKRFVFFLGEEEELEDFLMKEMASHNYQRTSLNEKYPVKLWGNFYNPYQRTELLASTYLSLTDLCGMIKMAKGTLASAPHSFRLPFQRSFTNNCRLNVGFVKFNIAYWKTTDLKDSNTHEVTNADENNVDSSEVCAQSKKNGEDTNTFKLATTSDHYTRDVRTETDVSEIVSSERQHEQLEDSNIPERDESMQSFSDKINSKIHQSNCSSNTLFHIPTFPKPNISQELYDINKHFTFSAHVVIERALHLPKISDKESKDLAPSTYVTFNTDDQTEFSTNAVRESCDPIWNWHRDVTFATTHPSVESGMNLKFQVLHQENDRSNSPESAIDKVLGVAVIELTPLLHGLSKLTGWYNITDASGKCQGQIKISISPERNEVFQRIHCSCTMQPVRNKQNKITKKDYLNASKQNESNSFPPSSSSLQKQLEELDLLHSYLMKRLAQLPNRLDESLISNNSHGQAPNAAVKQSNILIEEKENCHHKLYTDYARNDVTTSVTESVSAIKGKSKTNRDGQSHAKTKLNSEKSIECTTGGDASSCSVHFISGKQPVFNTPLSPHKAIQYTTYIHSKCINSSSSLHALDHEDGTKCDYCDKLEVINSTVETIDLSAPGHISARVNGSNIDLKKQHQNIDTTSKSDKLTSSDNKNNSPESLAISSLSSSPIVELHRTGSSQSDRKSKEEGETESSRDTLIESMEPV